MGLAQFFDATHLENEETPEDYIERKSESGWKYNWRHQTVFLEHLRNKKVKVFWKEECESVWKEERGIEQQLESKRCVTWITWNSWIRLRTKMTGSTFCCCCLSLRQVVMEMKHMMVINPNQDDWLQQWWHLCWLLTLGRRPWLVLFGL